MMIIQMPKGSQESPYPIADGDVLVRWRDHPTDPDARGYIVEANVGGVLMEGSGHYGNRQPEALSAAARIDVRLATKTP